MGSENDQNSLYFLRMEEISNLKDDLYSCLDSVLKFDNLTIGQVNYIHDEVTKYKGPQSELLSIINKVFEKN